MSKPLIGSVLLASFGAALVLAAPASAGTTEKVNREVRYGDLNLTTEAGVAQLQRRIKYAARQVCGHADGRDLEASQAVAACRKAALADAASKIELAVDNARSGRDLAANAALEVGKPVTR